MHEINRRDMLRSAGAAAATVVLAGAGLAGERDDAATRTGERAGGGADAGPPTVCLFTKPLQNRPVADLPDLVRELGFDAVDLTCRGGGHVLPERVEDDLPRAHELLKRAGVRIAMLTTNILDADKGHAEAIVRTAARLGIPHIKLGYYQYGDLARLPETLADVRRRLEGVAALFRDHGVQAGFHNHSGTTIGAAMWDVWELIRDLPPEAIGSYFDVRHATVEGGRGGWEIGLHLLRPRIVMVAVKDFLWHHDARRGWLPDNVPLGEGMVRCEAALRVLAESGFAGPVSLHMEYGQAMPEVGSEADRVNVEAIRRDHLTLRELMRKAGMS